MLEFIFQWGIFGVIVVSLLVLDLGVFHKDERDITPKESLKMSAFYISIGLLFGMWIWFIQDAQSAKEYFTGFIVEKSLSFDNIFVISLIFSYFGIPRSSQYRVLFWGIVGVVILRALLIAAGAALLHHAEGIIYVFAAFLVITGIKMFLSNEKPLDIKNSFLLRFLQRHMRVTHELHGKAFFVKKVDPVFGKACVYMTPLFVALLLVEFADLVFAIDSVPAIFAITTDTYVVYTSNIFAILGLRALYFAVESMIDKFAHMKHALALVLIFIGGKVIAAPVLGLPKINPTVSLVVTLGILGGGVVYSLLKARSSTRRDDVRS